MELETISDRYENCIVVIGAGPSGLATAYKLLKIQSNPVVLIEKNSKPGGLSGSFSWNDCVIDYGPHRFSTALPEVTKFIQDLLGEDILELQSKHIVRINGSFYHFPLRFTDFKKLSILKFIYHSATSLLKSKIEHIYFKKKLNSFESIIENRFGQFFKNKVIDQMVEKVWPGDTDVMDSNFAAIRFKVISVFEIIKSTFRLKIKKTKGLNPKVSLYPKFGYGQIFDEMLNEMKKNKNFIYFDNSTIIEIKKRQGLNEAIKIEELSLKFGNKIVKLSADNLKIVSSIPLSTLCDLLSIKISRELEIVSLRLYLYLFKNHKTLKARTYIFPQKDMMLNRIFEQNEYSRDTVPPGYSLLVGDLSFTKGNIKQLPTAQEIYRQLISSGCVQSIQNSKFRLFNFLKVSQEIDVFPVAMESRDIEYAYLRPSEINSEIMKEIQEKIRVVDNLYLIGRFGSGVYYNADFAIASGFKLAEYLNSNQSDLNSVDFWNQHHNIFG